MKVTVSKETKQARNSNTSTHLTSLNIWDAAKNETSWRFGIKMSLHRGQLQRLPSGHTFTEDITCERLH